MKSVATARPNARYSLESNIARVAISITAVKTRIAPRASANIACKGSSPQVMPSGSSRRMAPSPNTSASGGICCPRRSIATKCGIDLRVGRRLRAQSGRPKGRGRLERGLRLPDARVSLNNLTKPVQVQGLPQGAFSTDEYRQHDGALSLRNSWAWQEPHCHAVAFADPDEEESLPSCADVPGLQGSARMRKAR
jgi:hypothetical protein